MSGLCKPDLLHEFKLSTNGATSAGEVSATNMKVSPFSGSSTGSDRSGETHSPPSNGSKYGSVALSMARSRYGCTKFSPSIWID